MFLIYEAQVIERYWHVLYTCSRLDVRRAGGAPLERISTGYHPHTPVDCLQIPIKPPRPDLHLSERSVFSSNIVPATVCSPLSCTRRLLRPSEKVNFGRSAVGKFLELTRRSHTLLSKKFQGMKEVKIILRSIHLQRRLWGAKGFQKPQYLTQKSKNEKLLVGKLVVKCLAFCGNPNFRTMFTENHHWSLSWTGWRNAKSTGLFF